MQRIDLRALREGAIERKGRVDAPGRAWPDLPVEFVDSAELSVRAESGPAGSVRVSGWLDGTLKLTCRRCLGEVQEVVSVGFEALFRPEGGESTPERAVYRLPHDARELDLTEMLREELLLALPRWPECSPDCRGLCARCGADLNVEACDCVVEEGDPRWDALRALRS